MFWIQTEPGIVCFQNYRGRFVEYPSYPLMTGYHVFNNLLVKYREQNYYVLKILHMESNVNFCFVFKVFFPVHSQDVYLLK